MRPLKDAAVLTLENCLWSKDINGKSAFSHFWQADKAAIFVDNKLNTKPVLIKIRELIFAHSICELSFNHTNQTPPSQARIIEKSITSLPSDDLVPSFGKTLNPIAIWTLSWILISPRH